MKEIGLIGLGKMGFNLIQNIKNNGFEPIGFDINQSNYSDLKAKFIKTTTSLKDLINNISKPRNIIMLVPSGKITTTIFDELLNLLDEGDCIIDAGNSFYKDSINKYKVAKSKNINFVDCGTSGGQSGALNGVCLMVGGETQVVKPLEEFFKAISVTDGFLHTGNPGSGHFCKMIHNGIEYGMMQSIAEGYELLKNSEFNFDYASVSKVWNNGSVIRSWLIELMYDIFKQNKDLDGISDVVNMNGEGLWTVEEALRQGTPTPTIALSVMMRQISQQDESFAGKVLASLRFAFGGHEIHKK